MRWLLLSVVLLAACLPENDTSPLYVKRVVDGDTFIASSDGIPNQKIRIWGIDAPEKDEPYYLTSKLYLETIIDEGKLNCTLIDVDKYKRDVMRCYSDGIDIAGMMVHMGMAKDYVRYSEGYYEREEIAAQVNERGIWAK